MYEVKAIAIIFYILLWIESFIIITQLFFFKNTYALTALTSFLELLNNLENYIKRYVLSHTSPYLSCVKTARIVLAIMYSLSFFTFPHSLSVK